MYLLVSDVVDGVERGERVLEYLGIKVLFVKNWDKRTFNIC